MQQLTSRESFASLPVGIFDSIILRSRAIRIAFLTDAKRVV
jgi:hypothetical protein